MLSILLCQKELLEKNIAAESRGLDQSESASLRVEEALAELMRAPRLFLLGKKDAVPILTQDGVSNEN